MLKKKKKKYLAIDFGKKSLKFAVGSYHNFELVIDNLFMEILHDNVYENGKILDKEVLAFTISSVLKEHSVKVKDVICVIESSEIIRRELTIPKVDEDDIEDIVKMEIAHTLSIDLEGFVIQSKIIDTIKDGTNEKYKLSVAMVSKDIIEDHRDVIKEAKLKPAVLDLSSSAIENLVRHVIEKNLGSSEFKREEIIGPCIAMVEIGYSSALINIFRNGKLQFNRYVKIRDKSEDGDLFNLTKFKSIDEVTDMEIFNKINDVITEIDMVFKYYNNGKVDGKISEIFIFGGLGSTEGLDKYMEDIINITTNRIDSINTIIDSDKYEDIDISSYLNVASAIIRV